MKANTTAQNLTAGVNKKNQPTSPFGHTVDTMGGQIDMMLVSGKHVNLDNLLVHLVAVQGVMTDRQRLPQNVNNVTMLAMKIRPHLRWLTNQGGLNRAVAVFGEKQGNYRHGMAAHLATILLDEIKGLKGV